MPRLTILIPLVALAGCSASAQTGNWERGLAYSREACAACHSVEPGDITPPFSQAPSFAAISRIPGMTSMALTAWMHTSHPNMPNLVVKSPELDDLLAYFAALRVQQKRADEAKSSGKPTP